MNVNVLINKDGGVVLAISPDNDMEKEILRALARQDNTVTDVRGQIAIFNHSIRDSVLIAGKSTNLMSESVRTDKSDDTA